MAAKTKHQGSGETAFFTKFHTCTSSIVGSETEEHPFQTVVRLICSVPSTENHTSMQVNQLSQNQRCLQSKKQAVFNSSDAKFLLICEIFIILYSSERAIRFFKDISKVKSTLLRESIQNRVGWVLREPCPGTLV